jgi:hypothetical protein
MTTAADLIRPTVNIVSIPGGRCVSGESPPPPIGPLHINRFTHCRVSRREQSLRPSHTVVTDSAAAHRAACGRRPVPEDPIFHAVEREPILGWPVSRRYDVDKRPLRCLGQADQIRKLPVRARHSGAQLSEPRVGRVDVFPFAYIRDDFAAALWCFARIGGLE